MRFFTLPCCNNVETTQLLCYYVTIVGTMAGTMYGRILPWPHLGPQSLQLH